MRAWAPKRPDRPADRRIPKRKRLTRTSPPPPPPSPPLQPNIRYECGWTDSWCHRRCEHSHGSLLEAAKCGMQHGCGFYVFAYEGGVARELRDEEDEIVNRYRFGSLD